MSNTIKQKSGRPFLNGLIWDASGLLKAIPDNDNTQRRH